MMVRVREPRRCIYLCTLFLSLIACASVDAQQLPTFPQLKPFGIDGFRLMLQQRGLTAAPDRLGTALNKDQTSTVAVVLGDLKSVIRIRQQLNNFVLNGGALLIASDHRGQNLPRTPICGTWVRPAPVLGSVSRRKHGYRSYADCPIVTRFDKELEPNLFAGVNSIVTNRPAQIQSSSSVEKIAWMPSSRTELPLMARFRAKEFGRMLFVADHSIFINEMLVHGDNALFANNVTEWLCEGGQRKTLVLIHEGDVLPDWSFGASPPSIPLSSLLRAAQYGSLANLPFGDSVLPFLNESLARSQRDNEFNTAARRAGYAIAGGRGLRLAILLIIIVLAIVFAGWLTTTRATPRRWLSFQDWNQPRRTVR